MTTLVDFLLARIAEDEVVAQAARPDEYLKTYGRSELKVGATDGYSHVAVTTTRVLAECESKRRVVDEAAKVSGLSVMVNVERSNIAYWDIDGDDWAVPEEHDAGLRLLRLLALPYADHPDYREEWRA